MLDIFLSQSPTLTICQRLFLPPLFLRLIILHNPKTNDTNYMFIIACVLNSCLLLMQISGDYREDVQTTQSLYLIHSEHTNSRLKGEKRLFCKGKQRDSFILCIHCAGFSDSKDV